MLITLPPGSARLMPTTADLVARAIADTDFIGDLVPHADLQHLAADATDMAIDAWEASNDLPIGATDVPAVTIIATRRLLISHAEHLLRTAECDALDAAADALQAGDIDRNGNAMPYPTYRGA